MKNYRTANDNDAILFLSHVLLKQILFSRNNRCIGRSHLARKCAVRESDKSKKGFFRKQQNNTVFLNSKLKRIFLCYKIFPARSAYLSFCFGCFSDLFRINVENNNGRTTLTFRYLLSIKKKIKTKDFEI